MTLPEFLLARYDETEAIARRAYQLSKFADPHPPGSKDWVDLVAVTSNQHTFIAQSQVTPAFDHAARHDPAAVLADIEAKRAIVAWCSEREQVWVGTLADDPEAARPEDFAPGRLAHMQDSVVLRFLVQPYADHPDFDPDWRLDA